MPVDTQPRSFADEKHSSGTWRTKPLYLTNRIARAACSYLSFKRAGVDLLARQCAPGALVIDAGAGQGAYAHWFLGRTPATVLAIDWSSAALAAIPPARRGKILRVCADVEHLPVKSEIADALCSIDTLGHLHAIPAALNEMLRVVKPGANLFIHSECGSYRTRWPDRMLMKRTGEDFLARFDGHVSLFTLEELRSLVSQRFIVDTVFSPAGITGWLTGHPDKYLLAFRHARLPLLAAITFMFALVKKLPGAGTLLRLLNAVLNHVELAVGLQGGGSFFARCRKPERA